MTERSQGAAIVYDVDGTLADHFRPPRRALRNLVAVRPGPEGVLEGFWYLWCHGLTTFELPAWLNECGPAGEVP